VTGDGNNPDPQQVLAVDARTLGSMLNLSVRTIRTLDSSGKLPRPLRIGHAVRWSVPEIEAWLAAGALDRRTWESVKKAAMHPARAGRNRNVI
jgi:predicted DNA-binding transcriptional regulator AlpA